MHLNSIDALARRKNPEGVELIATVSTRLLPQKSAALMCVGPGGLGPADVGATRVDTVGAAIGRDNTCACARR